MNELDVHKNVLPVAVENPSKKSPAASTATPVTSPAAPVMDSTKSGPSQTTKAEISLTPKPLSITIDTPTDWPAIFVPFILGAAAVYFTLSGQRQQIRSSTANFRSEWITHLRAAGVDFSATAGEIKLRTDQDNDFVGSSEHWALISRLVSAQSTILLMLDTKTDARKSIREAMNKVLASYNQTEGDGFRDGLADFRKNCRIVLDEAWRDMKRDLGHSEPLIIRIWMKIKGWLMRKTQVRQSAPDE